MALIWNEINEKVYFLNNTNFLQYYFGNSYHLPIESSLLSQTRCIAKRLARLMPNAVHHNPNWSPVAPVLTVSRVSAVNGNLDVSVRVSVFLLEQQFFIGLFLDSKQSPFSPCIEQTYLYEYFKSLATQANQLKLLHRTEINHHLLIPISFYDGLSATNTVNGVDTAYSLEAEFSDQQPLISLEFEAVLKEINNKEYDTPAAAERLALFLSFRQLQLPPHTAISPRIFELSNLPMYQRPAPLLITENQDKKLHLLPSTTQLQAKPILTSALVPGPVPAPVISPASSLAKQAKPVVSNSQAKRKIKVLTPLTNPMGLNSILYGPTATGKTYSSLVLAMQALHCPEAFDSYQLIVNGQLPNSHAVSLLKNQFDEAIEQGKIVVTCFHASYTYEDFIEGLKVSTQAGQTHYRIHNGIFKTLAKKAFIYKMAFDLGFQTNTTTFEALAQQYAQGFSTDLKVAQFPSSLVKNSWQQFFEAMVQSKLMELQDLSELEPSGEVGNENANDVLQCPHFVLIIDEMNRANLSKVMGELLTLLEDNKRYANSEALTLVLPYSQEAFCVPANLSVVATINTAVQSVPPLDLVLRRRFDFIEMKPQASFLKDLFIPSLQLDKWLTQVNRNIAFLLGPQYTLGHALFASLKNKKQNNIQDLAQLIRLKILPLLESYFDDNWEGIKQVLVETQLPINHSSAWVHQTEINIKNSNFGTKTGCIYEWNYAALNQIKSYQKVYEAK